MSKRKPTTNTKPGRKKRKVEEEGECWYSNINNITDILPEHINKIYHINDVCQKSMFPIAAHFSFKQKYINTKLMSFISSL